METYAYEPEHSKHTVGGANYHLQFTPKYRRPVFRDDILMEACRREFDAIAARLGVRLEACEFGPDHVHLFVTGAKNYSASQLAWRFKGASARALRRDHPNHIQPYLWADCDSFWTDGYFHETVGHVTTPTVRFYIERQQAKHWEPPLARGHPPQPKRKGQTTFQDFAA